MSELTRQQKRYHLRLLGWLVLLLVVLLYAWARVRHLRSDWITPTSVALVLLDVSEEGLDETAVARLRERVPALEARLREEFERYRPGGGFPFHLTLWGPERTLAPAPEARPEGFFGLVAYNFELWRFSRSADDLVGLDRDAFPVRIYLRARPPRTKRRQTAEGASQLGGPIGLVDVELAEESVDFALFVATHELMHTRGASDKYGPDGLALFPDGFAEPGRSPLFPQAGSEVMARGRPVSAHREEAPDHLDGLTVGAFTALEIGWLKHISEP